MQSMERIIAEAGERRVHQRIIVVSDNYLDDSFRLKRRCSVRFDRLTQDQREQLKAFIAKYVASGR